MEFNRPAFEALLVKELTIQGQTPARWARDNGISPGTLHEIRFPKAGRMQNPSVPMVKRLAEALSVPTGALLGRPSSVAS